MSGKEQAGGAEEVVVRKRGRPKKIKTDDAGEGKRQKIDINLSADQNFQQHGYSVPESRPYYNEAHLAFPTVFSNNDWRTNQSLAFSGGSFGINSGNVFPGNVERTFHAPMGANYLSEEAQRAGAWNVILRVHGTLPMVKGGPAVFPGETGETGVHNAILCRCCRQPEIKRQTIICDSCEQSFHIECLKLPYRSASDLDDWNCASCALNTVAKSDIGLTDQQYQDKKQGTPAQKSAQRGRPRKVDVSRPERILDLNLPADASEDMHHMQVENGSVDDSMRFDDNSTHPSNYGLGPHQMRYGDKIGDVSPIQVKEFASQDWKRDAEKMLNAKQPVMHPAAMEFRQENGCENIDLPGSMRFLDAVDTTGGHLSNGKSAASLGAVEVPSAADEAVSGVTFSKNPEKLAILSKELGRWSGKSAKNSCEANNVRENVEERGRGSLLTLFSPPGQPSLAEDMKQTYTSSAFPTLVGSSSMAPERYKFGPEFARMSGEDTEIYQNQRFDQSERTIGYDASTSFPSSTSFRERLEARASGPEKDSQSLVYEEGVGPASSREDGEELRLNSEDMFQHMDDPQLKVIADETLKQLMDFLSEKYQILLPDGWMVDVKKRRNDKHLDKYFISPDRQRFRSRVEVMRYLGLADEPRGNSSKDWASPAHQVSNELDKIQVPFRCGDLTIESLGVVDAQSTWNHSGGQLCPWGYRSSWHDAATASVYISEVVDSGNQVPGFRVTRKFCPSSGIVSLEAAGSSGSGHGEGANVVDKTVEEQARSEGQGKNALSDQPVFEDSVTALLGDLAGPADEEEIHNSGQTIVDEVGEITVESSSPVLAWKMLAQEFVNRCRRTPWVMDSLPNLCPHVKLEGPVNYPQAIEISEAVVVGRAMESRFFALLERLGQDRFGLREGWVQEVIRLLISRIRGIDAEDRGFVSRQDGVLSKPNSQLRFRARERARKQKRGQEGEELRDSSAAEPAVHNSREETFAQQPLFERPSPPPGAPLLRRIPADLVGDVLQIWEFLSRFAPVMKDLDPPRLEDLEELLICGAAATNENLGRETETQPNVKVDGGNSCGTELKVVAASVETDPVVAESESDRGDLSAKTNNSSAASQMNFPRLSEGSGQHTTEGAAEDHRADQKEQLTGDSHPPASPLTVPKMEDSSADVVGCSPTKFIISPGYTRAGSIHIPVMNLLLSDLRSTLCGRDEDAETEESKPSKRGRKRVRDTVLRPILGREKLSGSFSLNEWTWPEIARRYIISMSCLSRVGEMSELTMSECLKVLRCIQGDGGVLCGALDGVASMEVDAQLLAEAEKELSVGTQEVDDSDAAATPAPNGKDVEESRAQEPPGDTARWIKILDPISKLPTNVGSRIRNRVRDALEADPPEWAAQLLEHSISKEVYKGNASGPTKRIVMEVISKYRGEDPKIRKTKKLRKRVVPSPEVVMQRCRIVLRQVAAEDKEHIVSKGIGEMITDFYESEGEGVLPRPLDFRAIDLRLGAGAYGTSPDAFAEDVRQIWKNVSSIYGSDSAEFKATKSFSDLFENFFSKQVIIFQRGVDNATASAATGQPASNAAEAGGQNMSGEGQPPAQSVQESVKAPWEDDSCRICGIDDDHDNVLLCDGCDAEYHIYCLEPPLQDVPEGNWYCSSCEAVDKGFLEEPPVTEEPPESKLLEKQDSIAADKTTNLEDVLDKEVQVEEEDPPGDAPGIALATKLEDTDYWHLSLAERVHFLKFLCDRALDTLDARIHIEAAMDVTADLQQKLRHMLLERRRFLELEGMEHSRNAFSVLQASMAKSKKQSVELVKEPVVERSALPNDVQDNSVSDKIGLELSLPVPDASTEAAKSQASACEDANRQLTNQEKHGEQILSISSTIAVPVEAGGNGNAVKVSPDLPENEEKSLQDASAVGTPAGTQLLVGNPAVGDNVSKVNSSSTEAGRQSLAKSSSGVDGDMTKIINPRALQNSRDTEIENTIAKLKFATVRRELLGKDDGGREYWLLYGCSSKPWVVVETLSIERQLRTEDASGDRSAANSPPAACHSPMNVDNDAVGGNQFIPRLGVENLYRKPDLEQVWHMYTDGDTLDKLIEWLSPTTLQERFLKNNLLNWKPWFSSSGIAAIDRAEAVHTAHAEEEGFVTPARSRPLCLSKTGPVAATTTLKAAKILKWRYGGAGQSGQKEPNSKRGRKKKTQLGAELARCTCLEPVWLSRPHCTTCHITFESVTDLEIHLRETSCSPARKAGAERDSGKKSKKGGQTGKSSQSKNLSEVRAPEPSSDNNCQVRVPLDVVNMPLKMHESVRDRVDRIGLIGDKNPSFAPGLVVSPAFDPTLIILDYSVGHAISLSGDVSNGNEQLLSSLAIGGTSCIGPVDREDPNAAPRVLVKSIEDLPGKADGALENSSVLMSTEDRLAQLGKEKVGVGSADGKRQQGDTLAGEANGGGRLLKVTGKQLLISEASLVSVPDRDLELLNHLKMSLFDIEAALTVDTLQEGRAQASRRQAWRSFVKKAKSIYTMVQATIILEYMVNPDFLRNSWGYWSSFSAAAKTATLSALSLRIYALDAAILYQNSADYVGPDLVVASDSKQSKKDKEKEEKKKGGQSTKSSSKKKRKDDASTS